MLNTQYHAISVNRVLNHDNQSLRPPDPRTTWLLLPLCAEGLLERGGDAGLEHDISGLSDHGSIVDTEPVTRTHSLSEHVTDTVKSSGNRWGSC